MEKLENKDNYAFIVLKPDAIRQFLDINILQELSQEGLEIIKQKMIKMSKEQVAVVYREKLQENYYHLLEKFLTEGLSICLILKSNQDAIRKAQNFKNKIREQFKISKFRISDRDIELLRAKRHPQQEEITREMALENLIHVADNFREVCDNIRSLFTEPEIQEIKEREPELYYRFLEYKREVEPLKEITFDRK